MTHMPRFSWGLLSVFVPACGSGDAGAGVTQAVSPGTATIEFSVAGTDSYCMESRCSEGPSIDIEDSSRHSLFTVSASCASVSCDTCSTSPCPGYACFPMGVAVTGATLQWDGGYNVTSTCGAETSCVAKAYAAPGKYTATFCATPGTLTKPVGGTPHCTTTSQQKCGSVTFDFPSSTTVKGSVGP